MNVAIVGITGYAGMTLYQLLKNHPHVDTIKTYQHDLKAPIALSELNSFFINDQRLVEPYNSKQIMDNNDVLFFATPAGVTAKLAHPFIEHDFPVIDFSGDFRLKDSHQYEHWYNLAAPDKDDLTHAYYGLSDVDHNPGAHYVANPGCYATATLLGLAPLVQGDLIDLDSIVVDAKSGFSGAGKKLTAPTHFVQGHDNLQIYKPNQHKHIPEIMAMLKQWNPKSAPIQFMTTLVPITRGIMSTIYAKVKTNVTLDDIVQQYQATYQDAPFVNLMVNQLPDIKSAVGTNNCNLGLIYNPVTNFLMVDSVIDNMIKGAAGQAIQNFNQMFDFDETAGLNLNPILS